MKKFLGISILMVILQTGLTKLSFGKNNTYLLNLSDTSIPENIKSEDRAIDEVIKSPTPPRQEKIKYVAQVTKYGFKDLFKNYSYNSSMPYSSQVNPNAETYMQDYLQAHGKYLEQMKAEGIASVLEVQVNANDKDLSAPLLKLKNSGAQVIFSQLHDNLYALVLRQAARLGLTIPHVAALSAGNTTVADLLNPNELAGVYFESFFWTSDPRPSVQRWVQQYKEKYKASPDSYVALGYDQAMVLYKVMQTYGVDRSAIQAGLRKITFDGFCGELKSDREQSMNHETSVSQWGPDKTYKRLSIIKVPFAPYQ